MSLLVVQMPARPRLAAQADAGAAPVGDAGEWVYALSTDGLAPQREGRAAAAVLPRSTQCVLVLGGADVSWHRITCPKAPAARLRAALAGVLEEALLDEPDAVHLALPAAAKPGDTLWVAACDKAWLADGLAQLERAGLHVDRVVPAAWPDEMPRGHFDDEAAAAGEAPQIGMTWSTADGVARWPLKGTLGRHLLPQPLPDDAAFTATAAAATAAERWLGRPVRVVTAGEQMLAAARSSWNLRQFDLAPRHRGLASLREAWRHFLGASWRPVRIGIAALVAVQILGLNAYAWQQRALLQSRRDAMTALVKTTFPQVQVVRPDVAALQMQRETDALRTAAGRAGDQDLEVMLQAAASAWPAEQPVQSLRYDNGQLTLGAAGLSDAQLAQWRDMLRPAGWQVDVAGNNLTMRRAASTP